VTETQSIALHNRNAMRNERGKSLGPCAWCKRKAVVIHLTFAMCGECFADASMITYDRADFPEWVATLPRPVAEQIVRTMLTRVRA
jgi:hypothetical protein